MNKLSVLPLFTFLVFANILQGQKSDFEQQLQGLSYRLAGPTRGGRVTAVCGVRSKLHTFYMGSTGGGVWKTEDAGTSWKNISDGFFEVGSIGSIAVAPSEENIIYVGTGSAALRGNVSIGKGLYKSSDGGRTWTKKGLEATGQIGKITVHPQDENTVYVAALGNPFGPNEERGIYKTEDGGENWHHIHKISKKTGAIDLVMDPSNPRILYAAMWTAERKPWTLIDGSEESSIYKTVDAGVTWTRLKGGLPQGITGKAGIAVSPVNSQRIWVIQEAKDEEKGGLYRSDDGGDTFKRINRSHELRQRAWYYNHLVAHPGDENTVFLMNVRFHKSIDGGEHFTPIATPHSDNHSLWINPDHPDIMIEGNDGGACVTLNGGKTWSSQNNQPTAEFYRVTVDNQFPYRLYGAQQDNTTISVPSKALNYLDPIQDWISVGGGESGHIAVDPRNPEVIYAGNYIGQIDRTDLTTGHGRDVVAYPQMHDGTAGRDIRYRFQWNAPIRISRHDPDIIYHCSQYVHKSTNGGQSWSVISPDLTTDNDLYQDIPGGPVQHDHTGVELYTTIFAFEESSYHAGELWAGSDDGLVHISKDGGQNWKEVTPAGMPTGGTVNNIELSAHEEGRAFISVYKYRENDFTPYIFMTNNFGESLTLLTDVSNGIPDDHFVRVVREDPNRRGLLFAGTEFGMYLSLDEGKKWHSFQQNLPRTPITDLQIKDNDLVVATQGRSFWILDDLSPLYSWSPEDTLSIGLYPLAKAYRTQLRNPRGVDNQTRAPIGSVMYFHIPEKPDSNQVFKLEIQDPEGNVRRVFSNHPSIEDKEEKISVKKGLNRFVWDLRYEKPETQKDAVFSLANTSGIKAVPGQHTVVMRYREDTLHQTVVVDIDPRWTQSDQDLMAQYQLTYKAMQLLNETHSYIGDLRTLRNQLTDLLGRKSLKKYEDLKQDMKDLRAQIDTVENRLLQTKSESGQDPINYPSQIDDQIAYLYSVLNGQDDRPTEGSYQRFEDLKKELQPILDQVEVVLKKARSLNDRMVDLNIPVLESERHTDKP